MSVLGAIAKGRRAAEALMLDSGTAKRPTGGYAYNSTTQTETQATTTLFSSPCKIQARDALQERAVEVGGRTATAVRLELHLPADTNPLTAGDLFTITSVQAASSVPTPRTYRVLAPFEKGLATARRYAVEVYVS